MPNSPKILADQMNLGNHQVDLEQKYDIPIQDKNITVRGNWGNCENWDAKEPDKHETQE